MGSCQSTETSGGGGSGGGSSASIAIINNNNKNGGGSNNGNGNGMKLPDVAPASVGSTTDGSLATNNNKKMTISSTTATKVGVGNGHGHGHDQSYGKPPPIPQKQQQKQQPEQRKQKQNYQEEKQQDHHHHNQHQQQQQQPCPRSDSNDGLSMSCGESKSGLSSIGQGHPNTDDEKSETSSIGSIGGHTHHTHGTGSSSVPGGGTGGTGGGGGGSSVTRSERSRSGGGGGGHHLRHSSSIIGLDSMIENRREEGDLTVNVVHMEVPFGKPIEDVYDGVHTGPVLGSGISGQVRLCTHRATGVKYAVKCLDLGLVDTDEGLAQLREEIFIMCQLDHPNIVRLEEVYESHSEIYLVQELCLGGELFDRLDEQPDYHYTEAECARLVKQMLCAVRYLHSRGIIHRDLKLENFLFSSTEQDSELKLIDFGLSKHFRYGEVQHEAVGTPYTVSPEVIKGSYDERCDIWAVGVISFLLLSGEPPFGGCGGPEPLVQVRSNILEGNFEFEPADIWDLVSDKARLFINSLLVINPKDRPTASQAQKHVWLTEWANRSKTDDDHILNPNVVRALVNFKEFSDMRKLLSEVLSFTLLPEQIKDLRREFEKMDTDGSGEISLVALKQVLVTNAGAGSLGALTEEEVEDIFNAMRVKKTETRIHWHEFIAAGLSQCEVDDRNLRLAFDRLDGDHKGYITLDDIMDLIGSDSLQSEEAMMTMWMKTLNTCNTREAHITYEDFLLIMKGQTRECNDQPETLTASSMVPRVASTGQLDTCSGALAVVHEEKGGDTTSSEAIPGHFRPNKPPLTPTMSNQPALDAPLSMDDDNDMPQLGFSPPPTPGRGMDDMDSPQSQPQVLMTGGEFGDFDVAGNQSNPDLDAGALAPILKIPSIPRPGQYRRQKSKSLDDSEMNKSFDLPALLPNDARRALALPETDREVREELEDKNYSALQVNRKLYRAHRQMRLGVMDACKRFEEQQARHARDVLLAQKAENGSAKGGAAGLVMRRVENKTVTSKEVKQLLDQNRKEQQDLMEKANRRGGRGRRTRKKTISDMSGMMGSLSAEEMAGISIQASTPGIGARNFTGTGGRKQRKRTSAVVSPEVPTVIETRPLQDEEDIPGGSTTPDSTDIFRLPTVPGNFMKVKNDPFSGLLGPGGETSK
eukprot:CAMPEP_0113505414 /NCGR_PEP_ID=MMETSP0014_2-20120614/35301_1 /TAXON_ID=2857 /ORGANISM="Nitzschia sp." /LENGTH=1148 /DNA_ID=CAMNT_0000400719 /DNA_START=66 /DNA_END=3512 /DNA_ORIENTATION=- /assembly_acc=CAM_ASM_000159